MKKVFLILMALMVFVSTLFIPPKEQAGAIGIGAVIPGGITIGAGAYTLMALGVAGVAGVVGYEHGDEIREHALNVWDGGTQLSKDSVNAMIEMAKTAGSGLVDIGQGLAEHIEGLIPSMAETVASTNAGIKFADYVSSGGHQIRIETPYRYDGPSISFKNELGHHLGSSLTYSYNGQTGITIFVGGESRGGFSLPTNEQASAFFESMKSWSMISLVAYTNGKLRYENQIIWQMYSSDSSVMQTYNESYQSSLTNYREAWRDMKDAGLVLPVDAVVGHVGDIKVDYDAQTDTYRGIDGNVYNPSDVQYKFPVPRVVTGNPDIPDGVYIDTPAKTGIPAIDDYIAGNPDIPKDTINVRTGESVGTTPITVPDTNAGFWERLWEWLQSILDAILSIPAAILSIPATIWDFLVSLFVPTKAISDYVLDLRNLIATKIPIDTDFTYLKGELRACKMADIEVTLYGKKLTIVKYEYVKTASDWFKPILVGLLWFLFGWYAWRKLIGFFNQTGGANP